MRYYGITVGPIVETLSLTARPAGLWYASYMFSDITRTLCGYFAENDKIRILAPYYEKDEQKNGIGSYFDKIFLAFDENDKDVSEIFVQETIQKVKTEVGERLARDLHDALNKETDGYQKDFGEKIVRFIRDYICIHYTSITEDERGGRIVSEVLSPYLDTLELYKNVQRYGEQNYLLRMFEGKGTDPNKYIKESELIKSIQKTTDVQLQLFRENQDRIRNLAYISGAGKVKSYGNEEIPDTGGWKKWKYYAVIQADGDHLGNVGKALKMELGNKAETDLEDILEIDLKVSEICKAYTKQCAQIIGEYGGTTIYAGGDDLLFLAPVQNRKGETIFEQCTKIREAYREKFQEVNEKLCDKEKTTLSVGISIYYWKFPLYEAVENARNLLFNCSKKTKNTLAVALDKASGSGNVRFQYYFNSYEENAFIDFLKETNKMGKDGREQILKSVLYHMKDYEMLFRQAICNGKETLEICMNNMFMDSEKTDYIESSKKMMMSIAENNCDTNIVYNNIISILQLAHFFAEEGE